MASQHPEASDPKKQSPYNTYLRYSSLAFQFVIVIGVFGWLGHKLDNYLELKFPVFILLFIFISFGGMLYQLYKSISKS